MLIHRLKAAGLLSFGPSGVDLPMEPLNVLIGPNGSGKSNFLEAIALLQAAPHDISAPVARMGGFREWLWKGPPARASFTLEADVGYPPGGVVRHVVTLADRNGRLEVTHEQVKPIGTYTDELVARSFNRPPEKEWGEWQPLDSSPNVNNENAGGQLGKMYSSRVEFESDCAPTVSLVSLADASDYPALCHLNRVSVWRHLKECYGWEKPRSVKDDPEVLAVPAPETAYADPTSDFTTAIVSRLNVALGRHYPEHGAESGAAKTLQDTSQPEEIIAMLRRSGLAGVADRLGFLRQLEHEQEDADDLPLALDSLRELARFLMDERWLPEPEIGVSGDGLAHAEWRFPEIPETTGGNGFLVMEFLCSGRVRFAAIATRTETEQEPSRIDGTLSKVEALRAVRPFTDQLQPI